MGAFQRHVSPSTPTVGPIISLIALLRAPNSPIEYLTELQCHAAELAHKPERENAR